MKDGELLECPMCGTDFAGSGCHSSCPLSRGCEMTRCPRCGYEFVGGGRIAGLLTKLFQRRTHDSRGNG
jgi:Zn-finger nucleic acid-binding protein